LHNLKCSILIFVVRWWLNSHVSHVCMALDKINIRSTLLLCLFFREVLNYCQSCFLIFLELLQPGILLFHSRLSSWLTFDGCLFLDWFLIIDH
jgi:hypothetical protein